jgi:protein-disulfide isomerase
MRDMPTYDLDVNQTPQKKPKKNRSGCAVAGWIFFAVALVLLVYTGYRMFVYYQELRRGDIVEMPQYGDHFTSLNNSVLNGPTDVPPAAVESAGAPAMGPDASAAKLTVVEFADFQCPYSKDEAVTVRTLMAKYGDRVRFEYRDYPLDSIHPDASDAALAARCAQEQGKFWAYYDRLFAESPALSIAELSQYAGEVGMDQRQFDKCVADQRYKSDVDKDRAAAQQLGLQGTPTFFFNGKRVDGAIPADAFENLIQKMLQ